MAVNEQELRRAILSDLQRMSREQAKTGLIPGYDLDAAAATNNVDVEDVRNVLSDLITEGKVEGFAETFGQSATDGACRITAAGLQELRE
jgi:hypothetical protein